MVRTPDEQRLLNLMGVFSLAVAAALRQVGESVTGLSGEAPAGLLTIGFRPGRPVEHLRRTLGLSPSGTVRLVDRLEGRGWVRRTTGEDGREVHLELTSPGDRVFRHLLEERKAALDALVEPVSHDARAALEEALALVVGALSSSRQDAWHLCRLCRHDVCEGERCPVGSSVDGAEPGGGAR